MMGTGGRQQSAEEAAEILEAWAEAIRADTAPEVDAERAERNARMADLLKVAAAALRARAPGDALFAAIRRASVIDAEGVPPGFALAQVYTDGREVVVCGRPVPEHSAIDCARMGCGPSAHVIFRLRARQSAEDEE